MEVLLASSTGLSLILNSLELRLKLFNDSELMQMLSSYVNDSNYFIKRQKYTSTTVFNPTNGVKYLAALCVGHGGDGWSVVAASNESGQGGTGGEVACRVFKETELPSGAVTFTIPTSSGSATTFGALLSAASGVDGSQSSAINSGPGTTTNSEYHQASDPNGHIFQLESFAFKGADGGGGGTSPDAGESGFYGSGGSIDSGGPNGGGAGSGMSSGGAGGDDDTGNSAVGEDATDPGCGGGGAFYGTTDDAAANGGAGGPAESYAFYVQGRA
jgi:hypothetical protein